jgi:hypothetical protein
MKTRAATFPQGQLLGFKPIEPIWTTPYMYNSNGPHGAGRSTSRPAWYVLGKQTHASRLLTFVSRPVPNILKPSYNFSGMSLSQLIEPYVIRWLKTVDSVNRLLSATSASTGVQHQHASVAEEGGDSTEC